MTDLNQPRVSVIMPVYNAEATVAEAIKSVLEQSYQDFELIIVNDGTPDSSMEVCGLFDDARIRIVHQSNRGLAGARNTGIRNARGEFIALLDSDDSWVPEKLLMHVIHFDASPQVGVSYAGSAFMDEAGQSIGLRQTPSKGRADAQKIFLRNPIGNGSAPVFRKEVFHEIAFEDPTHQDVAFFDETFRQSEDIECWVRIALNTSWKFEAIHGWYTNYRLSPSGLSANVEKQLEQWERMAEKVRAINPAFHKQWCALSRAYQYRYLARRALHSGDTSLGAALIQKAVKEAPQILVTEPVKTISTVAAVTVFRLCPPALVRSVRARIFGERVAA